MIIGLSGRMRSGKSELTKLLIKKGYKSIYFAQPLKKMCMEWLNVPNIDVFNEMKCTNEKLNILFDKDACEYFAKRIEVPSEVIWNIVQKENINGVMIKNVRHLLQFLGTNIIRNINPDWHMEKIRKYIQLHPADYVIEDVRFPNEKRMIEEMSGDTWYIIRPDISNVSNHLSEISLNWQLFGNNVLFNDGTLDELLEKWANFIDDYHHNKELRDETIELLKKEKTSDAFNLCDKLMISPDFFDYKPFGYDPDVKNEATIEPVIEDGKYKVAILWNDGRKPDVISNPLNIEDFKNLL
jgi:hypothetical protein